MLPVALTLVLVWALAAISAVLLFTRSGAPEIKSVWFVIIAAIPVAGALIYLLASVKGKPCGILKVTGGAAQGLPLAASKTCGTVQAGYLRAAYFKSGTEFFNAALTAIRGAKKYVYIEFFIIARGHIFTAFIEALEAARENGAEIKIICDGMGSAFRLGKRDLKKLKAAGAEIKVFHKLVPLANPRLNARDHRKIIAVDGEVAFTGGVNLADEYANISSPYGYWKDTGIAVYGSAAKIFAGMFLSMWQKSYEMPAPEPRKEEKNFCLPFYDSPPRRKFFEDAAVNAICSAKERVHVFTPYLSLSDKTASALTQTAKRGVDVKIIIPHIPDKKYAFEVTKAFAHNLKYSGVKIYEYTPGFMHAKSLICDGQVFLGSYNFDFRSAHFNYECGALFCGEICEEVERDFQECLALSQEVTQGKLTRGKSFSRFLLRFFSPLI